MITPASPINQRSNYTLKKMCNLVTSYTPFLIFFLNDKSIFNVPCGFGLRATSTMFTILDALLG